MGGVVAVRVLGLKATVLPCTGGAVVLTVRPHGSALGVKKPVVPSAEDIPATV
jgi:hypothetical protein